MRIDIKLLQRIRLELSGRTLDQLPSELVLVGEAPDIVLAHLRYLSEQHEIDAVEIRSRPAVLIRRLTPRGYRAMLEVAATDTARRSGLRGFLARSLKALCREGASLWWKTAGGVATAAIIGWIGLGR